MLVTLAEFQGSRYWRSDFSPEEAEAALRYAEERFYTLTNRHRHGYWLEPRELEVWLDGTGTHLLRAPYPILEVLEVRVLDVTGLVDITPHVRARGHFLYRGDAVFPEGFSNVQLVAEFGDPAFAGQGVPEEVKEAVRRLAYNKLRRHYRILGEELLERRAPSETPPPPSLTGDPEVDGIIRAYTIASPLLYLDVRGPMTAG